MTQWLGDYKEDETVYFIWSTNDGDGASITRSTDGTVQVYKDNGVDQSVAGVTDTEDFDGLTGIHACTIDLSSDAFYAIGADYAVVLNGAVIDTQTVNAVLAHFSIENRFNEVDVTHWLGTAAATPTTAGVPEVDITYWRGAAVPAPTEPGVPEVDITHIEGVSVDTNSAQIGANVAEISNDSTAADNCEAWFDGTGYAAEETRIADAILIRDWTSVAGEASRSTLNALRALRNKVTLTTTTIVVKEEDDTTTAWSGTITTNASADPLVEVDPT